MIYTVKTADIERFQEELGRMERSQATMEKYRRDVYTFYHWLINHLFFTLDCFESKIKSKPLCCVQTED